MAPFGVTRSIEKPSKQPFEAYLHLLSWMTLPDAEGNKDRGQRMRPLIIYTCDPLLGSEGIKLVGLGRRAQRAFS